MEYLGVIKPLKGKWSWPLRQMERGDYFHVDPLDKTLGEVRMYAYPRALALGVKFSVRMDESGMIRVQRVDDVEALIVRHRPFRFAEFTGIMQRLYGIDAASFGWEQVDYDEERFSGATRRESASEAWCEVIIGRKRFYVSFRANGFAWKRKDDRIYLERED